MKTTRIINLFRVYFIENKKMLLICCLIVFAGATLDLTMSYSAESSAFVSLIIPLWIAGRFFQPSLKKNNSTHFFNLPVTTIEKFVYAIVIVVIFGFIVQLLFIAGTYAGFYGLRPILNPDGRSTYFEEGGATFNFAWSLKFYLLYGVVLFVFLFGSIYFKKNAFWKTLACGIGFFVGLSLYIPILFYIAFGDMSNIPITQSVIELRDYSFIFTADAYIIISIAVILFFLSLTYLRLKETEV